MPRTRCTTRLRRPPLASGQIRQVLIATDESDMVLTLELAFSLALELGDDGTADHEIMVLGDEDRRVTAIFIDPDPMLGLMPALLAEHFAVDAFTGLVVTRSLRRVVPEPASDDEITTYRFIDQSYADQGIELLDMVFSDGQLFRSMDLSLGAAHWTSGAEAA
jgi:hypothetical protein